MLLILFLVFAFYYPLHAPLKSRYVYYSDLFERAGSLCNPEYGGMFQRYTWETFSPLATLLALLCQLCK